MAANPFEDSRIAEGTMRFGAQHISNIPDDLSHPDSMPPAFRSHVDAPRQVVGMEVMRHGAVRSPAGDSLGKIEDIMVDLSNGRIAYAVLSFGGLFGIGNKLFILPWSALSFDRQANHFILDIDREVLEKGPGFDKNQWPDLADPVFGADVHRHYGRTPYWEHTMTDFSSDEFTANRCCE